MHEAKYLANVCALLPAIRRQAAECESLRRLPDETLAEYQKTGILRALQPTRWGGFELSPLTFFFFWIIRSSATFATFTQCVRTP